MRACFPTLFVGAVFAACLPDPAALPSSAARTPAPATNDVGPRSEPPLTKPARALVARAEASSASAVAAARAAGATVVAAPGAETFAVRWTPGTASPRWLVSLHGHEGQAFEDVNVWSSLARARGFAVLAPQWWVGRGDRTEDYVAPDVLYRQIDALLRAQGATPKTAALHGFSRGSTLTYALAAMDHAGSGWFGTVIANAGGAHTDFPPTGDVERGRYGKAPFAGQSWVLFCAGRDPDPRINGCPAMRQTSTWITGLGGRVSALLEDRDADHGGFHKRPANAERALDLWLGG